MSNFFLTSLSRLGAFAADAHRRSQTRGTLEQLSDRQLADIGLSRGDIPGVVMNGRRI